MPLPPRTSMPANTGTRIEKGGYVPTSSGTIRHPPGGSAVVNQPPAATPSARPEPPPRPPSAASTNPGR